MEQSDKLRIQVLCFVVLCYKFCVLDRFNKRPEATDEQQEESEIDLSKIETAGLHFEPPLSLHVYNEAKEHARNSETHGGIEPVIRQRAVKWPFSMKVVNMVLAYAMHPDVTQSVAFGTREVVDADGVTTTCANVFRRNSNRELAFQIQKHLEEQVPNERHPSFSTIIRMLENMPASKTRSLEVSITKLLRVNFL